MCLWALLSAGARSLGMGNVEPWRGTGLRVGPRPTSTTGETQPHHGEIWEGGGGKEGADLALGPSVGHTDLSKWKPLAIITTMEAGHQPGVDHRHTPKPTFAHFHFCAPP